MMSGRITSATARNRPPRSGLLDRLLANTCPSFSIHVLGAIVAAIAGLKLRYPVLAPVQRMERTTARAQRGAENLITGEMPTQRPPLQRQSLRVRLVP
jgi:hypothetical protein